LHGKKHFSGFKLPALVMGFNKMAVAAAKANKEELDCFYLKGVLEKVINHKFPNQVCVIGMIHLPDSNKPGVE
jgi:hypothetical protein